MALINCPECKTEVSESALKCPKCGVQLKKPTRSTFGKIIKWSFIVFNVFMFIWLIAGTGSATQGMENMNEAQRSGAAIGTGIGAFLIIMLWALGDVILGLVVFFTRPKS